MRSCASPIGRRSRRKKKGAILRRESPLEVRTVARPKAPASRPSKRGSCSLAAEATRVHSVVPVNEHSGFRRLGSIRRDLLPKEGAPRERSGRSLGTLCLDYLEASPSSDACCHGSVVVGWRLASFPTSSTRLASPSRRRSTLVVPRTCPSDIPNRRERLPLAHPKMELARTFRRPSSCRSHADLARAEPVRGSSPRGSAPALALIRLGFTHRRPHTGWCRRRGLLIRLHARLRPLSRRTEGAPS